MNRISKIPTTDSNQKKKICNRLKHDLVIVSCDTITNCNLFELFDSFRNHDASMTALLVKSGFEGDIAVPGPKTKYEPGAWRNF